MAKNLRIGMIGYGFMGRAHSNAYKRLNDFFPVEHRPVLQAVAARNRGKAQSFADNWGYRRVETDWRKVATADDIDLVDVCAPNHMHLDIVLAAAEAGKMICCEKPLAMSVAEAEQMVEAVEKYGVPNMVWYNYRRVPSISLARQVVDEVRIAKPFHYR
ncbi:MAG: Gfo/Idh/MocA family oxidoreductase, partial [Bryobacterales bacterium]|nr:Gfo/Idh/MocA family oxidoreductase [Bryobacterales bacterium]